MNVFFVPKGKYYPREVLLSKIIYSLGYIDCNIYCTSKTFGNLMVIIIYDESFFENGEYKKWIGVEDFYMPVWKLLIKREYNGMGFEYSLFGANSNYASNYYDDSILELLRSKFPCLPDTLDYSDLNSEEAISLYEEKLKKASEKECELYEKIAEYHEKLIRERQEKLDEWMLAKHEEEMQRWFEKEGYRDAYDNNPDALWNTD